MATSVGDALALLKKVQTTSGSSVLDGITKALAKVLEDRPVNAVEALETSVLSTPPGTNGHFPLVPSAVSLLQPSDGSELSHSIS
jgi:radial spoke head protein 4A